MITIEQGESSPFISVDAEKGKMVLKGNSFISNPQQFYSAVTEWGKTYKVKEGARFDIEVTMGYYSTSNIQLLNLFFKTLNQNNPGRINLLFLIEEEEEEDLEETMLSLIFNTHIPLNKKYIR